MKTNVLPFFNDRKTGIDVLMFHCSAQHTAEMIEVLRNEKLSCHYIVDTDGKVTQLVSEDKRAWHAGLGSWRDIPQDMNSHSIGIELTSPSFGQEPYPQAQIDSLTELSRSIIKRYNITAQNVIGHSDSAPTRKPDPGKAFPWQQLAERGIGLWYDLQDACKAPTDNIKELLAGIGYNTEDEESFRASQYAFARRFLPELIATDINIPHLLETVYTPETDFHNNSKFIAAAQAVYMRFKA